MFGPEIEVALELIRDIARNVDLWTKTKLPPKRARCCDHDWVPLNDAGTATRCSKCAERGYKWHKGVGP